MKATKLNVDRDVYAIDYDRADVHGETVKAEFRNNADVSDYTGVNDGRFIVTVAVGYTGTDDVTITGSDDTEGVEGQVTFG